MVAHPTAAASLFCGGGSKEKNVRKMKPFSVGVLVRSFKVLTPVACARERATEGGGGSEAAMRSPRLACFQLKTS